MGQQLNVLERYLKVVQPAPGGLCCPIDFGLATGIRWYSKHRVIDVALAACSLFESIQHGLHARIMEASPWSFPTAVC